MLRRFFACILLVLLGVQAEQGSLFPLAHAFQVQAVAPQVGKIAVRWNQPVIAIHLHKDGAPSVTDGSDLQALRKAFQLWSQPTCNNLQFSFKETTTDVFAGRKKEPQNPLSPAQKDGKSVIRFESKSWEFGDEVIAKNATFFKPQTGELQETDLLFNAVHFKWSANQKENTLDILTVALPRIGQMLGLWYSDVEDSVMHASFNTRIVDQKLRQDDINGSCFLYPTTGWKNPPPPQKGTTQPKPEPPPQVDAGTPPQPKPDTPGQPQPSDSSTGTPKTGCDTSSTPFTPWSLLFMLGVGFLCTRRRKVL